MQHIDFLIATPVTMPFLYYTQINGLNPEAAAILERANQAFAQGNMEKTALEYRAALAAAPHSTYLKSNLGALLCAQGHMQEGTQLLKESAADQEGPSIENCAGAYNLGTLLAGHGIFDGALHFLTRAEQVDNNNAALLNNIGVVYLYLGKLDEAHSYFDRALISDVKNDSAATNIGLIAYKNRKFSEAIEWFERALSYNPQQVIALNNLGCAQALESKHEEAYANFVAATKIQSNYKNPYFNIGFMTVHMIPEYNA